MSKERSKEEGKRLMSLQRLGCAIQVDCVSGISGFSTFGLHMHGAHTDWPLQ